MKHPGITLAERFKAAGVKQKAVADRIGMSPTQLNEVLHGKRPISPKIAVGLETLLFGRAKKWLYEQANYDLWAYQNTEATNRPA